MLPSLACSDLRLLVFDWFGRTEWRNHSVAVGVCQQARPVQEHEHGELLVQLFERVERPGDGNRAIVLSSAAAVGLWRSQERARLRLLCLLGVFLLLFHMARA